MVEILVQCDVAVLERITGEAKGDVRTRREIDPSSIGMKPQKEDLIS